MTDSALNAFRPDRPQTEFDLYNRKPFADQLANLLVLPPKSPGIVVGIEGAWGSGKTTVVDYIIESLKTGSNDAPIVVEFNPWMLAGADALVEALLTELASGIGMDDGKQGTQKALDVAKKMLGYAGLLRHLKYLKYVPGVSLVGVTAEAVGDALHTAGELAGKSGEVVDGANKVVEEAEKLVSLKTGLSHRKKDVTKALAELDRGIVFVVDDLDRLMPEEIKAVFRTIKAVADFPRVAYLLAYDRTVIAENLGGGPVAGGAAYIEKIVQVAYPISPAFPWQLHSHLEREIEGLLERIQRKLEPFEVELLPRAVKTACAVCSTPRDLVRLTNRLTLSLASSRREVNAADVIVIEALFQRFPEVREAVLQNPEHFTGFFWSVHEEATATDWSRFMSHSKDERSKTWEECLPADATEKRSATVALNFLFPMTSGISSNSNPRRYLRIAEQSRLIRFLAATSVTGVQEVADIHRMLASPYEVADALLAMGQESATEMVNHMTAYSETSERVDAEGLLAELLKACRQMDSSRSLRRDLSRASGTLAAHCLQYAKDPSVPAREFVDGAPLLVGFDFLMAIGKSHGEVRDVRQNGFEECPVFIDDIVAVQDCVSTWIARVLNLFATDSILKTDDLFTLLYGLAHLGRGSDGRNAVLALKRLCTQVPAGLQYFLDTAKPYREMNSDFFYLYVWNADEMAALVESTSEAADYTWYIDTLRSNVKVRRFIEERNDLSRMETSTDEAEPEPDHRS